MKRSDIDDAHVVELARRWLEEGATGVVDALVDEGVPEKLAISKIYQLSERGLLEYGVTPRLAWPTRNEDG